MAVEPEREKLPDVYEPSWQDRQKAAHDRMLGELPDGLRQMAIWAEEANDLFFSDERAPSHLCKPRHGAGSSVYAEYACSCGVVWSWNGYTRQWKIKGA